MTLRNIPNTTLVCAECGMTKGVWQIVIGIRMGVTLCTECIKRLNTLTDHKNREKVRVEYGTDPL